MTTASKITLVRVFMIPLVMIAMYLSRHCGGMERQGENRQHHDWPVRRAGVPAECHPFVGGNGGHRGDHGVFRCRVFCKELELPVELMLPRHRKMNQDLPLPEQSKGGRSFFYP